MISTALPASCPPVPAPRHRPLPRVATACAVFAVNALVLTALSLIGGGADAKPAASANEPATAATSESAGSPAAQASKAQPDAKKPAVPAKPKLRARKFMPVGDFGGY